MNVSNLSHEPECTKKSLPRGIRIGLGLTGIVIGLAMVCDGIQTLAQAKGNLGKELVFNHGQLFVQSPVTEAEAQKLGNYLVAQKFFEGKEKTVQIQKAGQTYEFRFPVKKGAEQDASCIDCCRELARNLSHNVFCGDNVDVHLCDEQLNTLRVVTQAP